MTTGGQVSQGTTGGIVSQVGIFSQVSKGDDRGTGLTGNHTGLQGTYLTGSGTGGLLVTTI